MAGDSTRTSAMVRNGSTVLQAVNETYPVAYQATEQGVYVTAINGTAANSTHAWIYLVNGEPPEVGVGSYTLETGDTVTFRFLGHDRARSYFE